MLKQTTNKGDNETFIQLDKLGNDVLENALTTAYLEIAPKKLADQIRPNDP